MPLQFEKLFSTVLIHTCLYSSHVWAATASLRPERAALVLERVTWAWLPQDGRQRGLQQPEGQRNNINILLCSPFTNPPPSALSLSTLWCLFSGRAGFLCDGALDERRKRGMGREEETDTGRWIGMGVMVPFGGVGCIGCFSWQAQAAVSRIVNRED